jgi:transposase InsO family protein
MSTRLRVLAKNPALAAALQLEQSPTNIILEAEAYGEMIVRERINSAARASMLPFATGSDLDVIGARFNVQSMDGELDPRLRRRIQLSMESFTTAGSPGSYIFHALSTSTNVKDATAVAERGTGRVSVENPLWGAPRIHGELLKLGFELAQSSVAKYMVKRRGPPSQGWRTFLRNHAPDIAAMDLFVVPTIGFNLLYAFVIIRLDRRDLVWINVTTNPTAEWIAHQITEAFPWDEAPRYLIRDRDRIYGTIVTRRLRAMGIRDKPTASASPWQNGFAERLIGSIRRECADHIIVFGEAHLRRILRSYACYYNGFRTHRSLDKDAPISRLVQRAGVINSRAILGGLHHHYCESAYDLTPNRLPTVPLVGRPIN